MRAVVISEIGGSEVLKAVELDDPKPARGQVLIRVAYAGVNFAEVMARRGDYHAGEPPFVPGFEIAGHIEALGEGVTNLKIGQPVAALTVTGGYAELALAKAALTFPLDTLVPAVDLKVAAAFPTIVLTAYDLLVNLARLRPGETVLVHAAAGGVGTIAGQLARYLKAGMVLGTVGNPAKIEYTRGFGFDNVFSRDGFSQKVKEATAGRGVDVVLDSIGEPVRSQSLELLAPQGRLIIFGNAGQSNEPPTLSSLWLPNQGILGYSIGMLSEVAPELIATSAKSALELVAKGDIRIDITEVLPLDRVAEAHRLLEKGDSTGKLVLQVS